MAPVGPKLARGNATDRRVAVHHDCGHVSPALSDSTDIGFSRASEGEKGHLIVEACAYDVMLIWLVNSGLPWCDPGPGQVAKEL